MSEEQPIINRLVSELWDQYEEALRSIISTAENTENYMMMIIQLVSKLVGFVELIKVGQRALTGMEKKDVVVQLGSKALRECLDMEVERNQTIVTMYDDYVDDSIEMLITLSRNVNVQQIQEVVAGCSSCFSFLKK